MPFSWSITIDYTFTSHAAGVFGMFHKNVGIAAYLWRHARNYNDTLYQVEHQLDHLLPAVAPLSTGKVSIILRRPVLQQYKIEQHFRDVQRKYIRKARA